MHPAIKCFEKGLSVAANGAWAVFSRVNKFWPSASSTPRWSDRPLLKSWEKTKPLLGWPRQTDSLCPICVRETRQQILDGKKNLSILINEKVGEIKATILERDRKIMMVKDCPIHGHFEDVILFNYDFRRTEMCIIPYATQQGEISFCAYNTGVGWRQIVEKMHMTATLVRWYEEHGRHEIFASGKSVPLASTAHSLTLDPEAVNASVQTELDESSIPKTAHQERLRGRLRNRNGRNGSNRAHRPEAVGYSGPEPQR
jgi:hypothetical protein